jgi:MinD-like ATPase involved in chromosome partitioning or flagellar assembly
MKKGEVEAALETKIRFEVPSDRVVPLAVNRSNPAVLSDPKSDFGRAVREMAKSLLPAKAAAENGKRRFLGKNGS